MIYLKTYYGCAGSYHPPRPEERYSVRSTEDGYHEKSTVALNLIIHHDLQNATLCVLQMMGTIKLSNKLAQVTEHGKGVR